MVENKRRSSLRAKAFTLLEVEVSLFILVSSFLAGFDLTTLSEAQTFVSKGNGQAESRFDLIGAAGGKVSEVKPVLRPRILQKVEVMCVKKNTACEYSVGKISGSSNGALAGFVRSPLSSGFALSSGVTPGNGTKLK
jgi:hypothetical protein